MTEPDIVLSELEIMALRGALIGLLPLAEGREREKFEERSEKISDLLVETLVREAGILENLNARSRLYEARNSIDHFGKFQQAVRGLMWNRKALPPVRGQRRLLLKAVAHATIAEARSLGLPRQYVEWAHLAVYCAMILYGPPLFLLPSAPAVVSHPFGYVPSQRELSPENGDR